MSNWNNLHLYEEILLLALKDREGTIFPMVNYHFALGGAILAELILSKRIDIDKSKRFKTIQLLDHTPLGDPIIDQCLQKIREARRRARIETWIQRFSNLKDLKHRAAERLCWRGILRADQDKVLLIFKRKIYPEVDPIPERQLVEKLRQAVLTGSQSIEPRTVILLSIAKSTELLKTILSKSEIKQYKDRIKRIVEGELTGMATKEAIESLQAAVTITTIIPAISVATTTTS